MQNILTPLGAALTDTTRRSFSIGFGQERMGGRSLFNVQDTDKRVEVFNSAIMDNFAHDTGDGENFYENESVYGDELTITQSKYTGSVEITRGVQMFDQYNVVEVMEGAEGLGRNHSNKIEQDIQQFVKNGAGTSYVDIDGNTISVLAADGVTLFSSSHTVNGSSSTYDNVDSTAYGQTGMEVGENLARNFLNHEGQRANKLMNTIFSTTESQTVNLIKEYRNATNHVEDAARGINTRQGKYDHIAMEYLDADTSGAPDSSTDTYWGLALRRDKNLKFRVSQRPIVHDPRVTERSRNLLIQSEDWHAIGVEDPNCILLMQA